MTNYFPMHPAIRPVKETTCDNCGKPCDYDQLDYRIVFHKTMIDPEEGVWLCDDCGGGNE